MNRRTVIVSGGLLEEDFAVSILKDEKTEFIIGVDKGLEFLYKHRILPDYIVGDLTPSRTHRTPKLPSGFVWICTGGIF